MWLKSVKSSRWEIFYLLHQLTIIVYCALEAILILYWYETSFSFDLSYCNPHCNSDSCLEKVHQILCHSTFHHIHIEVIFYNFLLHIFPTNHCQVHGGEVFNRHRLGIHSVGKIFTNWSFWILGILLFSTFHRCMFRINQTGIHYRSQKPKTLYSKT